MSLDGVDIRKFSKAVRMAGKQVSPIFKTEGNKREPGSDDPSSEQEKFSGKKRNTKPEFPTYGKGGKTLPPEDSSELDLHI